MNTVFFELDKGWFEEQTKNQPNVSPHELYSTFVKDATDKFQIDRTQDGGFVPSSVLLGYPGGTQTMISDVAKLHNDQLSIYNFGGAVWKNSYVIAVNIKTDSLPDHYNEGYDFVKTHPSFTGMNEYLHIIGVVDESAKHCTTC